GMPWYRILFAISTPKEQGACSELRGSAKTLQCQKLTGGSDLCGNPQPVLYHVFSPCLRDVELILAERSVVLSYETVRRWCKKFGTSFADRLRRRRPRPGDKWHMEEVFVWIQGVQYYLWRAVDQDGVVLDILVQARRDATAANALFRR